MHASLVVCIDIGNFATANFKASTVSLHAGYIDRKFVNAPFPTNKKDQRHYKLR